MFSSVTGCYLSIGMFGATNTGPGAGKPYDDPGYVPEQYRDATNLGARTALRRGQRVTKDTGMFVARR